MRQIYLILAIIGAVVPYSAFSLWMLENPFQLSAAFDEIMASRLSQFAWLDVLISGVVLLVFMRHDQSTRKTPHLWFPIMGTLLIGVSFGLPLFLYLREGSIDAGKTKASP